MNKLAWVATLVTIGLVLFPIKVRSQLIPDNTLGRESSRVVPVSSSRDNIEGGVTRETNLFHSFQEFNVDAGREVYFNNPVGVENILTRVTGANLSNIFGTLGVSGNANLFLINPNGIIFGEGVKLDVNGAFVGSTASEIKLGNNGSFSASNPSNSNLLSVKPSALFFNALASHQNQITVRGNLEAKQGKTLALLGGNIAIDGGQVLTPSGQIFLGAVNSGTVNLDLNNNTIDYSGVNSFGDIQIINRAKVRATTENLNGKGIDIAANNLLVNNGSQISVDTSGTGNGGNLNINASNIEITGGFRSIDNNGDEQIERTEITANVGRRATGNGGNININSDNLRVLNTAQIRANTGGIGQGGNINIIANNLVEISGFVELRLADGEIDIESSRIEANINESAIGNGGNININSDRLIVADRADLRSRNRANGNSLTANDPKPRNGKIIINTNTVRVLNGGNIELRTSGVGNSRDPDRINTTRDPNNIADYSIYIKANNLVEIAGVSSDIRTNVDRGAVGNGGNILIDTDTLRISQEGDIQLDTRGSGDGGSLDIFARRVELLSGGGIENDVGGSIQRSDTTGNSGDINIVTNILNISKSLDLSENPRSEISTENFGQGNVGKIDITANFVNLDNGFISARTATAKDGGNIFLNIGNLLTLRNGSEIRANARDVDRRLIVPSSGNAGSININSPFILARPRNNKIITSAPIGDGGDITISTRSIFGFPQFLTIDANGGAGELAIDGQINIDTLDITPGSIFRQLETNPVDVTAVVARDLCRLQDGKIARGSSFIITGKGGLPPTPSTPVSSYKILLDWTEITSEDTSFKSRKNETVVVNKKLPKSAKKISFIAAKGWRKRADGSIVLTANPISNNPVHSNLNHPNCSNE